MADASRSDVTTVLLVLVGLVVLWPLLMGFGGMMGFGGTMGSGGMMSGPYGDGGYNYVGVLFQFAFLAILLGGGFLVARRFAGRRDTSDAAIEELRRAYARGDLSDEEFERRRETLDEE